MNEKYNWANALTSLRFIFIVPISLAVAYKSIIWILVFYTIGALTDLFDGLVARKLNVASKWGAKYDAAADIAFSISIFAWLVFLFPERYAFILVMFAVLMVSLILQAAFSFFLLGKIISPHLQPGRVAAVIFGIMFPVVVLFDYIVLLLSLSITAQIAGRIYTIFYIVQQYKAEKI